jgi:hypothetical protein
MEREEGGRLSLGAVEMPVGERPDAGGGTTEHGHGTAVISV